MGTIDLIPPPESLPVNTDDYVKQNALIQQLLLQYNLKTLFLTNWGTTSKPQIKQGVSIHHGGSQFIVNTSNVDISGAPADGRVYVKLTRVSDQLQASFTNDASGFTWNYIYNGFYDTGGNQLLPVIIIYDSSTVRWWKYTLEKSRNPYNIEAKILVDINIDLLGWDIPGELNRGYPLPTQFLLIYNPLTTNHLTNYIISVKIQITNDDQDIVCDAYYSGQDGAVAMNIVLRIIQEDIYLSAHPGEGFDLAAYADDNISRGNIHLGCLL